MGSVRWHEDMLFKGRALLRGWLRADSPFHANLALFLVCDLWERSSSPALVVVSYVCGREGSTAHFSIPKRLEPWRTTLHAHTERWGHRREATWVFHKQVVVTGDDRDNAQPLPTADPRMMMHYGTFLEAIQGNNEHNSVEIQLSRQVAADRLRYLILEQFKLWRQVAPI